MLQATAGGQAARRRGIPAAGGTLYDNADERWRARISRAAVALCHVVTVAAAAFAVFAVFDGPISWDFVSPLLMVLGSTAASILMIRGRVTTGAIVLILVLEVIILGEPYFLFSSADDLAGYVMTAGPGFVVIMLLASLFVGRPAILIIAVASAADVAAVAWLSGNEVVLSSAPYVAVTLFLAGLLAWLSSRLFTSALSSAREEGLRNTALREQLLHAQKMDAIGRLAGGVAHDFNNILAAMHGQTDLILLDDALAPGNRALVEDLKRYAERAATLTRRLLVFARKQPLQPPRPFDAVATLAGLETMLRRIIGREVILSMPRGTDPVTIVGDPGQFEQVLVNLVVNARDAMPGGGTIGVSLTRVELSREHPTATARLAPGRYAALAVQDTGVGMDETVRARLFEPFFTTKPQGQGTGLGLSTVYGIVTDSGGGVAVSSEPGKGSTFVVYLPCP
jgi:signal transduction histidine kinase